MTDRFAVVGCMECDQLWIIEELDFQETAQCPHCGYRKDADLINALKESDSLDAARELISRVRAKRAGYLDEYLAREDWGTLYKEVNAKSEPVSLGEDEQSVLFDDLFEEEAKESLSRFESLWQQKAETHNHSTTGAFKEEAESVLSKWDSTLDGNSIDFSDEPSAILQGAGNGSIVPSEQKKLQAEVAIDIDDISPSGLWKTLATDGVVQDALVSAVRQTVANADKSPALALYDKGVTGKNGGCATLLKALNEPSDSEEHQQALDMIAQIGSGEVTTIGHLPLSIARDGPLSLLAHVDDTPTVAVRVTSEFRSRRRDKREEIVKILSWLGEVLDVQVLTTRYNAKMLHREHREHLPSEFREVCDSGRHSPVIEDALESVRTAFDDDGRHIEMLRALSDAPGETLAYGAIKEQLDISKSRLSQLKGDLEDHDLAQSWYSGSGKEIELRPLGRKLVETLDEEIGRQQALDDMFRELPKSDDPIRREDTRTRGGQGTSPQPDRNRCDGLATVQRMREATAGKVSGTAKQGGIRLLDHPVEERDDRREPWIRWDETRGEAVVSVEHDNPMQQAVSTARGLASRDVLWNLLSPSRIEEAAEDFLNVLTENKQLLRDASCYGWLPDDIEDVEDLQDNLAGAREELLSLTSKLAEEEYSDRDSLRGDITRSGLGLTGTMVGLLCNTDVDVTLEVRVPRYRKLTDSQKRDFANHLAKTVAICSQYRRFSIFRTLFENREQKRDFAQFPTVDASEPFGRFLASVVVVGPGVEDLEDTLTDALSNPAELHDDAPELSVNIPVSVGSSKQTYEKTLKRVLFTKNLRLTEHATALLAGLTKTPYDAAEALDWLEREEHSSREIRLDEVRLALAHLDPSRLLPGTTSTTRDMFAVMLQSERVLSRQEIVDKADVSGGSFDNNFNILVETGLVEEVGSGYRICLPFEKGDERGENLLPDIVDDPLGLPRDILFDIVLAEIEDTSRLTDYDAPLAQAFDHPFDVEALSRHLPWLEPWISILEMLCPNVECETPEVHAQFGRPPAQTSIQEAAAPTLGAD